jgi:hypothetical protein
MTTPLGRLADLAMPLGDICCDDRREVVSTHHFTCGPDFLAEMELAGLEPATSRVR